LRRRPLSGEERRRSALCNYLTLMSGPKLSPAGMLRVVLPPMKKESGLIDPPVFCSLASYDATPKGELALIAASSPFTNAISLGASHQIGPL
jgi:hypothetical protein